MKNQGFTLLELMVVVVVLGILTIFSIPVYQNYMVKTQVSRVFYEMSGIQSIVESVLAVGHVPTLIASQEGTKVGGRVYEYIGVVGNPPQSNLLSQIQILEGKNQSFLGVEATFGRNASAQIAGAHLRLNRNAYGNWSCEIIKNNTIWRERDVPDGCILR